MITNIKSIIKREALFNSEYFDNGIEDAELDLLLQKGNFLTTISAVYNLDLTEEQYTKVLNNYSPKNIENVIPFIMDSEKAKKISQSLSDFLDNEESIEETRGLKIECANNQYIRRIMFDYLIDNKDEEIQAYMYHFDEIYIPKDLDKGILLKAIEYATEERAEIIQTVLNKRNNQPTL